MSILSAVNVELNPRHVKVTKDKDTGEYRVAYTLGTKEEQEASAYYTDDIQDAHGTGKAMAEHAGY